MPCRLDHSVWKQSYNACPTVLYSIDQSCRTRVLDLDSSRSTRVRFLEDLDSKAKDLDLKGEDLELGL